MKPAAPDGARDIIVAVDTFSKWVELGTVTRLDSTNVTRWFHANIVCRYGLPGLIRTDGGMRIQRRVLGILKGGRNLPPGDISPQPTGQRASRKFQPDNQDEP